MDFFYLTSFFIFGIIIGSFLNVVILRYNTGVSITGRSGCFSCGKKLEWYELFPILSFLLLQGRCSQCKAKISLQYPLVELFTGFIFASYVAFFPIEFFPYYLTIFSILIIITVYDLRHKIIPDGLVYTFIALSALKLFYYTSIFDLLAGPILFTPFFLLWYLSKGKWMGFGDAKLAIGIGFFMGFTEGVSSIILGFWIGAVAGLLWIGISSIFGKHIGMKTEIPFAPYLILGMLITFFFHINVII
ncbi:MAG: prepilin peptidase [Patescibacteria group bacterium]|nr:prepilin peptidase [Patescibacteria group bacterium]